MRIFFCTFLLTCLSYQLVAQVNVQKLVASKLKVIREYVILNEKVMRGKNTATSIKMDKVIDAVIFLEELSGIKCDREQSFDRMFVPSRSNLKAWKGWYRKNKSLLYWNEKGKKVNLKR